MTMKTVCEHGNMRVWISSHGYAYASGQQASCEEANACRKELADRLKAISPEAFELARAWKAACDFKPQDVVQAQEKIRKGIE